MLAQQLSIARLVPRRLSLRPLRPPSCALHPPALRLFTQNSSLLLVSRIVPRPELPFLHVAATRGSLQPFSKAQFQYQLARLLTTERKRYLKHELKNTVKYIAYGLAFIFLINVCVMVVYYERLERKRPTPSDWSFISRYLFRRCTGVEDPNVNPSGLIDWAEVYGLCINLISRLEDPSGDGKGLEIIQGREVEHNGDSEDIQFGFDVSSKSEPWRRGYHAALMGAARAAERLDGWVSDTTRKLSFPGEVVIGPSNPRPRPVPYGVTTAPLEENCRPAAEPPADYYSKILTTAGFTSRQRLEAALAYADWLEFKGLPSSAEEIFNWGLDIAMGALPHDVNNAVDIQTGIVNNDATFVSENLLDAANALAIHHAVNNNVAMALPILASVLRARRNLSIPPVDDIVSSQAKEPSTFGSLVGLIKSIVISPPYPPLPPSGDEAPIRNATAICKEAAIMAHIGEILFASSNDDSKQSSSIRNSDSLSQKKSGLSWTRDAVDVSENTLLSLNKTDTEARRKCSECLEVGLENWSTMVRQMIESKQTEISSKREKANNGWGWFWNRDSAKEDEIEESRWQRDEAFVEERKKRVSRLLEKESEGQNKPGIFAMLFL